MHCENIFNAKKKDVGMPYTISIHDLEFVI